MRGALIALLLLAAPVLLPAYELSGPVLREISRECAATGVPVRIVRRLLWRESRYNPRARNPADPSVGIAQLAEAYLPYYSREFNGGRQIDPYDPVVSVRVAIRYLARLYRRYGDWWLAIVAYNEGPGIVDRGIYYPVTQEYASWIVGGTP